MSTAPEEFEVVVVGGGPAGSTASNLLAQHGHRVVLIERETFPRFHIGESLLPCGLPIYIRLGVDLSGEHLRKSGAEFIDEATGQNATYDFSAALPGGVPYAYQVERATFDDNLLRAAQRAGAIVREGEEVTECAFDEDGVTVATSRGNYRARFLVDATGQDALFAKLHRSREPIQGFGKAAVFCHFEGLRPDATQELLETGNIKVLLLDQGWSWLIPLRRGALSVGLVSRKTPFRSQWLDDLIDSSATIQHLTRGAKERTPSRVISNFSYRNSKPYGARWACIGDASCFLDPVFSSGVSLAVITGERIADALSLALTANAEGNATLMQSTSVDMTRAYETVGALIHSFYHTRLMHNLFFAARGNPELVAGLTSILAGDVWRDDNRFQNMLLQSKRRSGSLNFDVES